MSKLGGFLRAGALALLLSAGMAHAQTAAPSDLGATPSAAVTPRLEFAFEYRVTLAPAVVVGETAFGRRQYIPITGGKIAGPKLSGEVVPGGWDYQLGLAEGCSQLSADYFIRAADGALIHVLNEGMFCPPGKNGERSFFRPRFEAPKGSAHEWLTRSTFVATLETERTPAEAGGAPQLRAIRLKFFQVK